ncbi:5-oxoprolinase subunit PxpA [Arthrobacter sp. E3]|uniref:LamB/YcsF family protein n=1 Tax=Arthrobacter sp. E3 TaxID=517402 RepID=UPI001A93F189|nr:5-oxoprolinase subunit PxpA [Arthrobacter sp. E3]
MTEESAALASNLDLNADVGELLGQSPLEGDAAIMAQVSSVNIACGFHAGGPSTMRRSCATAAAAGVVIGAHPSYRDLAGFGRRFIDVDPDELTQELIYQIGALQAIARAEGATVRYVKPHGALYNAIVQHSAQAQAVVSAVLAVDPGLAVLVAPHSQVQLLGQAAGLTIVTEAFADRAYNPDGTLVSRSEPGAVLHSVEAVVAQSLDIALRQEVTARDGSRVKLSTQSLCLHGDTPGAVQLARAVRAALASAGVQIGSFA